MAFPDSGCGALPGGCAAPGVTQRSDDAYMHASTSLVDKLICLGVSMNPQVVVEGYIEIPTNELSLGARSRRRLPRRCELGHSIGDEREEGRGVVGGTEGGGERGKQEKEEGLGRRGERMGCDGRESESLGTCHSVGGGGRQEGQGLGVNDSIGICPPRPVPPFTQFFSVHCRGDATADISHSPSAATRKARPHAGARLGLGQAPPVGVGT